MIVCHNLENRQTMKINAFAGTGKTTTLIAYAAKRMDESFLYIAYNKFDDVFQFNDKIVFVFAERFKLMRKRFFHPTSNVKRFIRWLMRKSGQWKQMQRIFE